MRHAEPDANEAHRAGRKPMLDQKRMSKFHKMAEPLYDHIGLACQRIVGTDGELASVEMSKTMFVLDGRTFNIRTGTNTFRFWFGANGPRLFFIAYMRELDPARAREAFAFCFGGAAKVGWELNYEPIENGVSIWATCMTEKAAPLVQVRPGVTRGLSNDETFEITADGHFWATDVAMMVQSWIRTSERLGFACHEMEPAPL